MGSYYEGLYPENFILLGNPFRQKTHAKTIILEMEKRFPERFEGKIKDFFFELRYVPPFDKGFNELKRLQGAAAEAAGRRDEFRGYVVIDLSNYLSHDQDHYLDIALQFLADMSDFWKYIFLVDNKNSRAAKELVGTVLTVLLRDISCEVKEDESERSSKSLVDTICREQSITCVPSVKQFFQEMLDRETFSIDVIVALLRDISRNCGVRIRMHTLSSYFEKGTSVVKYMLTEKQYDRLMNSFEHRKENEYDEKEAV